MGILSLFGLNNTGCINSQSSNRYQGRELHYTINDSLPKNYYLLTMSCNGCNFRILINDVPVYGFWDTGMYTGSYPINHFILRSGVQKLKVELYPVYQHEEMGINSEEPLYLEIKKRLNTEDLDDYVPVLINPIPKIQKGIPYYEYECIFKAEVSYEISELDSLVDLSKEVDIEKQVVAKYNEIKELYEKKKYTIFQDEFRLRDERIKISHYLSEDKSRKILENDMNLMKGYYKKVAPIENYNLKLYGDNKLILLEDKYDLEYLFRLDDGGEEIWPIPFYLGKRKGSDKLEIVF